MKKKVMSLFLALCMCVALCIPAFAWDIELDLQTVKGTSAVRCVDTVSTNVSPVGWVTNIYSHAMLETTTGVLLAEGDNTLSNTTSCTAIAGVGSLSSGSYINRMYGRVDVYNQSSLTDNASKSFTYSKPALLDGDEIIETTDVPIPYASIEMQAERGCAIFESFGMNPDDYLCVVNWDIENYLPTDEHFFVGENSEPHAGDTCPVYFISKDEQTIYSVKQELYGTNYLFTFVRDESGNLSMPDRPQTVESDILYVDPSTLPTPLTPEELFAE